MLYTLQNTEIICEIDTHGAELKSIKEKKTGLSKIRNTVMAAGHTVSGSMGLPGIWNLL